MGKYGRHTPAFILIFLVREPAYGLDLLRKMEEKMPNNRIDSAAIYRALGKLEDDGAVESYWDTSESGPAKKWYRITEKGINKLKEYKKDIEMRRENLNFFIEHYQKHQKILND